MADSILSINIGIDFGTSFTKVCVFADDLCSEAVTFSQSLTPKLEESILLSKIGILKGGEIISGVTQLEWNQQVKNGLIEIEFIKMRLANLDISHEGSWFKFRDIPNFEGTDLNTEENIENICAYFLSRVLARTKQWFPRKHPDRVKNRKIQWSANIGVPVKYYNSKALKRFEKVLRIAWLITDVTDLGSLTLKELDEVITKFRENIDQEVPCFAVPEVAAGTYSYTASRKAQDGYYVFIDVGSGTIETVYFHFLREQGSGKLDFIAPYVYPLGLDALVEGISKASGSNITTIKNLISVNNSQVNIFGKLGDLIRHVKNPLDGGEFVATVTIKEDENDIIQNEQEVYISKEFIEKLLCNDIVGKYSLSSHDYILLELMLWQNAIHRQVAKVVMMQTNIPSPPPVIFLSGGGGETNFYRYTIKSTYSAFKQKNAYIPSYTIKSIPCPDPKEEFKMNGIDPKYFYRFGIAYGLSIPYLELPEFKLPSSDKTSRILYDGAETKLMRTSDISQIIKTINAEKDYSKEDYEDYGDWREAPNLGLGRIHS